MSQNTFEDAESLRNLFCHEKRRDCEAGDRFPAGIDSGGRQAQASPARAA